MNQEDKKTDNNTLRILFFGDIVGKPGRKSLAKVIPRVKKDFSADLVVANIENAAHGKGITEKTLTQIKNAGVDVFTSGEHIYDKATEDVASDLFKQFPNLVRPINLDSDMPGRGEVVVETSKGKVLILNLIGQVFIRGEHSSPWKTLDGVLKQHKDEDLVATILDFHAEATSEKVALGLYFDGRLSAVLGTHTHIPTADTQVLPKGTAYITDVGMNGPKDSVLGMKPEVSIGRFLTGEMLSYEIAESPQVWLNYAMIEIDTSTGKAIDIKHKQEIVKLT